jgi:hypothetical protein
VRGAVVLMGVSFRYAQAPGAWIARPEGSSRNCAHLCGPRRWTRWSAGLERWAGRTVAAISVALAAGSGGADGLGVRLGELRLADARPELAPATPTGSRGNPARTAFSWAPSS